MIVVPGFLRDFELSIDKIEVDRQNDQPHDCPDASAMSCLVHECYLLEELTEKVDTPCL